MNHPSEGRRSEIMPRRRPTSLDLILQARAMRHQWFVAAFARLGARSSRFGLIARSQPDPTRRPALPERQPLFGRPVT